MDLKLVFILKDWSGYEDILYYSEDISFERINPIYQKHNQKLKASLFSSIFSIDISQQNTPNYS